MTAPRAPRARLPRPGEMPNAWPLDGNPADDLPWDVSPLRPDEKPTKPAAKAPTRRARRA